MSDFNNPEKMFRALLADERFRNADEAGKLNAIDRSVEAYMPPDASWEDMAKWTSWRGNARILSKLGPEGVLDLNDHLSNPEADTMPAVIHSKNLFEDIYDAGAIDSRARNFEGTYGEPFTGKGQHADIQLGPGDKPIRANLLPHPLKTIVEFETPDGPQRMEWEDMKSLPQTGEAWVDAMSQDEGVMKSFGIDDNGVIRNTLENFISTNKRASKSAAQGATKILANAPFAFKTSVYQAITQGQSGSAFLSKKTVDENGRVIDIPKELDDQITEAVNQKQREYIKANPPIPGQSMPYFDRDDAYRREHLRRLGNVRIGVSGKDMQVKSTKTGENFTRFHADPQFHPLMRDEEGGLSHYFQGDEDVAGDQLLLAHAAEREGIRMAPLKDELQKLVGSQRASAEVYGKTNAEQLRAAREGFMQKVSNYVDKSGDIVGQAIPTVGLSLIGTPMTTAGLVGLYGGVSSYSGHASETFQSVYFDNIEGGLGDGEALSRALDASIEAGVKAAPVDVAGDLLFIKSLKGLKGALAGNKSRSKMLAAFLNKESARLVGKSGVSAGAAIKGTAGQGLAQFVSEAAGEFTRATVGDKYMVTPEGFQKNMNDAVEEGILALIGMGAISTTSEVVGSAINALQKRRMTKMQDALKAVELDTDIIESYRTGDAATRKDITRKVLESYEASNALLGAKAKESGKKKAGGLMARIFGKDKKDSGEVVASEQPEEIAEQFYRPRMSWNEDEKNAFGDVGLDPGSIIKSDEHGLVRLSGIAEGADGASVFLGFKPSGEPVGVSWEDAASKDSIPTEDANSQIGLPLAPPAHAPVAEKKEGVEPSEVVPDGPPAVKKERGGVLTTTSDESSPSDESAPSVKNNLVEMPARDAVFNVVNSGGGNYAEFGYGQTPTVSSFNARLQSEGLSPLLVSGAENLGVVRLEKPRFTEAARFVQYEYSDGETASVVAVNMDWWKDATDRERAVTIGHELIHYHVQSMINEWEQTGLPETEGLALKELFSIGEALIAADRGKLDFLPPGLLAELDENNSNPMLLGEELLAYGMSDSVLREQLSQLDADFNPISEGKAEENAEEQAEPGKSIWSRLMDWLREVLLGRGVNETSVDEVVEEMRPLSERLEGILATSIRASGRSRFKSRESAEKRAEELGLPSESVVEKSGRYHIEASAQSATPNVFDPAEAQAMRDAQSARGAMAEMMKHGLTSKAAVEGEVGQKLSDPMQNELNASARAADWGVDLWTVGVRNRATWNTIMHSRFPHMDTEALWDAISDAVKPAYSKGVKKSGKLSLSFHGDANALAVYRMELESGEVPKRTLKMLERESKARVARMPDNSLTNPALALFRFGPQAPAFDRFYENGKWKGRRTVVLTPNYFKQLDRATKNGDTEAEQRLRDVALTLRQIRRQVETASRGIMKVGQVAEDLGAVAGLPTKVSSVLFNRMGNPEVSDRTKLGMLEKQMRRYDVFDRNDQQIRKDARDLMSKWSAVRRSRTRIKKNHPVDIIGKFGAGEYISMARNEAKSEGRRQGRSMWRGSRLTSGLGSLAGARGLKPGWTFEDGAASEVYESYKASLDGASINLVLPQANPYKMLAAVRQVAGLDPIPFSTDLGSFDFLLQSERGANLFSPVSGKEAILAASGGNLSSYFLQGMIAGMKNDFLHGILMGSESNPTAIADAMKLVTGAPITGEMIANNPQVFDGTLPGRDFFESVIAPSIIRAAAIANTVEGAGIEEVRLSDLDEQTRVLVPKDDIVMRPDPETGELVETVVLGKPGKRIADDNLDFAYVDMAVKSARREWQQSVRYARDKYFGEKGTEKQFTDQLFDDLVTYNWEHYGDIFSLRGIEPIRGESAASIANQIRSAYVSNFSNGRYNEELDTRDRYRDENKTEEEKGRPVLERPSTAEWAENEALKEAVSRGLMYLADYDKTAALNLVTGLNLLEGGMSQVTIARRIEEMLRQIGGPGSKASRRVERIMPVAKGIATHIRQQDPEWDMTDQEVALMLEASGAETTSVRALVPAMAPAEADSGQMRLNDWLSRVGTNTPVVVFDSSKSSSTLTERLRWDEFSESAGNGDFVTINTPDGRFHLLDIARSGNSDAGALSAARSVLAATMMDHLDSPSVDTAWYRKKSGNAVKGLEALREGLASQIGSMVEVAGSDPATGVLDAPVEAVLNIARRYSANSSVGEALRAMPLEVFAVEILTNPRFRLAIGSMWSNTIELVEGGKSQTRMGEDVASADISSALEGAYEHSSITGKKLDVGFGTIDDFVNEEGDVDQSEVDSFSSYLAIQQMGEELAEQGIGGRQAESRYDYTLMANAVGRAVELVEVASVARERESGSPFDQRALSPRQVVPEIYDPTPYMPKPSAELQQAREASGVWHAQVEEQLKDFKLEIPSQTASRIASLADKALEQSLPDQKPSVLSVVREEQRSALVATRPDNIFKRLSPEPDPVKRKQKALQDARDIAWNTLSVTVKDQIDSSGIAREWFDSTIVRQVAEIGEYLMQPGVTSSTYTRIKRGVSNGLSSYNSSVSRPADIAWNILLDTYREMKSLDYSSQFLSGSGRGVMPVDYRDRFMMLKSMAHNDAIFRKLGARNPKVLDSILDFVMLMEYGVDEKKGFSGYRREAAKLEDEWNKINAPLKGVASNYIPAHMVGFFMNYAANNKPEVSVQRHLQDVQRSIDHLMKDGKAVKRTQYDEGYLYKQTLEAIRPIAEDFISGHIDRAGYEARLQAMLSPEQNQWIVDARDHFAKTRPIMEIISVWTGAEQGFYENYIPLMGNKMEGMSGVLDTSWRPIGEKVGTSRHRSAQQRFSSEMMPDYMADYNGARLVNVARGQLFSMMTAESSLLMHDIFGTIQENPDGTKTRVYGTLEKLSDPNIPGNTLAGLAAQLNLTPEQVESLSVFASTMRMVFDRERTGFQGSIHIDNKIRRGLIKLQQIGAFYSLASHEQLYKQTIPGLTSFTFRTMTDPKLALGMADVLKSFGSKEVLEAMKRIAPSVYERGVDGQSEMSKKLELQILDTVANMSGLKDKAKRAFINTFKRAEGAASGGMRIALDWTTGKPDALVTRLIWASTYAKLQRESGVRGKDIWRTDNPKNAYKAQIAAEELMAQSELTRRGELMQIKGGNLGSEALHTSLRAFGAHNVSMAGNADAWSSEIAHGPVPQKLRAAQRFAELGMQNVVFRLLGKAYRDLILSKMVQGLFGLSERERERWYEHALENGLWGYEPKTRPIENSSDFLERGGWLLLADSQTMGAMLPGGASALGYAGSLPVVQGITGGATQFFATTIINNQMGTDLYEGYKEQPWETATALLGYPGVAIERLIDTGVAAADVAGRTDDSEELPKNLLRLAAVAAGTRDIARRSKQELDEGWSGNKKRTPSVWIPE